RIGEVLSIQRDSRWYVGVSWAPDAHNLRQIYIAAQLLPAWRTLRPRKRARANSRWPASTKNVQRRERSSARSSGITHVNDQGIIPDQHSIYRSKHFVSRR